ncbi:DNA-binding protein [Natronorubrum sp. DTA7]|uniref:DNA-binding protein n=1 Tax=Natronorubrum sp. DTA7 TaxID=3447016 RepID=UPI003F86903E
MRLAARIVVSTLLLAALFGLCVHYGGAYDDNWPHPTGDQLRDEYDAYAGERVLLIGSVQSVDGETIEIHVTDSADEVAAELEIYGLEKTVAPGGTVQVYGVLESDRTMTADETVVVDRDSAAFDYKLVTSVVGVLLAIGSFGRHWTVNPRTLAVEPRGRDVGERRGSDVGELSESAGAETGEGSDDG